MNILQSLNITRMSLFKHHIKNQGIADHPDVWHAWKFYIWPGYSQMLTALINDTIDQEPHPLVRNMKIIRDITGLEWDDVKEKLL